MKRQDASQFFNENSAQEMGSIDNAVRFANREGYRNDEDHLRLLKASYKKYNYLSN